MISPRRWPGDARPSPGVSRFDGDAGEGVAQVVEADVRKPAALAQGPLEGVKARPRHGAAPGAVREHVGAVVG